MELLYFFEFLVFLLGFGLLLLLVVLDELFLHEEVVLDPFELELAESALGDRGDYMGEAVPPGSLAAASMPLFFFLWPTLGGGGMGFFLAWSLPLCWLGPCFPG